MMLKDKEGFTLPIVLLFLLVMLTFTQVAFKTSLLDIKESDKNISDEDALYYAEAGFNRYLYFLNQDPKFYESERSLEIEGQEAIGFKKGFYNLEITKATMDNPFVLVRSTGWVKNKKENSRTIEVKIRRKQFTNFVYGTNSEKLEDGTKVWWISGDEVDGPIHTNGTLHINGTGGYGPLFNGELSYSTRIEIKNGSNPVYNAGNPYKREPMIFPENNDNLKSWAKKPGGYYYQGRTCILLKGDKMDLRYFDEYGNEEYEKDISLPENGVIYVDNLDNENNKFDIKSGNIFISGELDGRLTIAAQNDIYITGYDPTNWDSPEDWDSSDYTGGIKYKNQIFDENNDDMLGLVAQRNIKILHYGWPRYDYYGYWWLKDYYGDFYDFSIEDVTINAALFALNGSFSFEAYDQGGEKGTISFYGSMVQNNRGAVGQFGYSWWWGGWISDNTGYKKDYKYDSRMAYETPPHFLEPENAGWEIINWREIN